MPAFVEPMRPTLAAKPFSDPAYLFELKLDGWRTLCFLRIVALDKAGLPQFAALRSRRRNCSVVFYAFDLLHLDGYDLTGCPLIKRKTLLKHILPRDNTGRIRFTDHIIGNGEALFQKVEALKATGNLGPFEIVACGQLVAGCINKPPTWSSERM